MAATTTLVGGRRRCSTCCCRWRCRRRMACSTAAAPPSWFAGPTRRAGEQEGECGAALASSSSAAMQGSPVHCRRLSSNWGPQARTQLWAHNASGAKQARLVRLLHTSIVPPPIPAPSPASRPIAPTSRRPRHAKAPENLNRDSPAWQPAAAAPPRRPRSPARACQDVRRRRLRGGRRQPAVQWRRLHALVSGPACAPGGPAGMPHSRSSSR